MFSGIGAVAQLGERLLCKQDVVGSIPSGSTIPLLRRRISDPANGGFFHREEKISSAAAQAATALG
jgi:hypothetical protein